MLKVGSGHRVGLQMAATLIPFDEKRHISEGQGQIRGSMKLKKTQKIRAAEYEET